MLFKHRANTLAVLMALTGFSAVAHAASSHDSLKGTSNNKNFTT
ncbi:hypothetical protein [Igneacidithiobacillus copahuensis]|nr:hypothetical protein [Igneacidithiobacillus copahuensis]